jgi:integrase
MDQVIEGVKRGRTARDRVPLVDALWTVLQEHRRMLNPAQLDSGYVFSKEDGTLFDRHVLDGVWPKLLKRAGVKERVTRHGLRRAGIDMYRRAGIGMMVSKAIAGHTTDAMHAHYSSVSDAERRSAGAKAFAGLRLVDGGNQANGDPSGDLEKVG